jgi:hypothetical protein
MNKVSAGIAELLLIADEPIGRKHIDLAITLAGQPIDRAVVQIVAGRTCTWPLRIEVPSYTSIDDAGGHLWYIANYLRRKRETITAIRSLGCNLRLTLYGVSFSHAFSIDASTLKKLGELDIQLEFRA